MDGPQSNDDSNRTPWLDRLQALFEIILLSGLLSSFLAALPFAAFGAKSAGLLLKNANFISAYVLLEAGITFLFLAAVLKAHHETLKSIGLRWDRWKLRLLMGLAPVPFLFLANGVVILIFRAYFPKYYIERNPLAESIHTPQQLVLFVFSALIAGGIKEELQRAFILTRFSLHLGGAWLGLVLWSLAFGAGHYVQGMQGVVTAVIFGFVFGAIYLMSRCVVPPMISHGVYDALALLAYWFSAASLK